jgi:hypothetical protein
VAAIEKEHDRLIAPFSILFQQTTDALHLRAQLGKGRLPRFRDRARKPRLRVRIHHGEQGAVTTELASEVVERGSIVVGILQRNVARPLRPVRRRAVIAEREHVRRAARPRAARPKSKANGNGQCRGERQETTEIH